MEWSDSMAHRKTAAVSYNILIISNTDTALF